MHHVADCTKCAGALHWIRTATDLMRTDDSQAAPAHVVARAWRILSNARLNQPPVPRTPTVRYFIAQLQCDSGMAAASAGVRSPTVGTTRRHVFEASCFGIDLQVSQRRSDWLIHGQVLGAPEAQPGTVTLSGSGARAEASMNELLEFQMPPLPAGTYSMDVTVGSSLARIQSLELGP